MRYVGGNSGIEVIKEGSDDTIMLDTKYQVNNLAVIRSRYLCAG